MSATETTASAPAIPPATRWSEPPRPRHAGDVREGDELPVMTKQANRAQLFLYSAITWNPHRIHYDRDYARFEGHPDVIVHGPLQGSWLTQYVTDWAGPAGRLVTVAWQNRASALPERDVVFRGRVTGVDDDIVHLEVQATDAEGGRVLMPGTASVRLSRRT
jgi:hydroxyacyl-ACP dehydratase HTD2-like protein with hotdog domain